MLKALLKMRNKKGFTLIELVVVLVIMVILAAMAVPTMMGYVDNAKKATHLAECRAVYVAAQTELTLARAGQYDGKKVSAFTENVLKIVDLDDKADDDTAIYSIAFVKSAPTEGAEKTFSIVLKSKTEPAATDDAIPALEEDSVVSVTYFYATNKSVTLTPGAEEGTNVFATPTPTT